MSSTSSTQNYSQDARSNSSYDERPNKVQRVENLSSNSTYVSNRDSNQKQHYHQSSNSWQRSSSSQQNSSSSYSSSSSRSISNSSSKSQVYQFDSTRYMSSFILEAPYITIIVFELHIKYYLRSSTSWLSAWGLEIKLHSVNQHLVLLFRGAIFFIFFWFLRIALLNRNSGEGKK